MHVSVYCRAGAFAAFFVHKRSTVARLRLFREIAHAQRRPFAPGEGSLQAATTVSGDGSVTAPWTAPARQSGPALLARCAGLRVIRRVGHAHASRRRNAGEHQHVEHCRCADRCRRAAIILRWCGAGRSGRIAASARMPWQSRPGSPAGFNGSFCQLAAVR